MREIVRHPGAVVILPLLDTKDGVRIALIRQYRASLGREIVELPAGTLEPMEPPADAAARELAEETGYEAAELVALAKFYTTPGITDELMWAFVARGLRHVGQRLQPDESLTLSVVTAAEAIASIDRGDLVDAKSIATLLLAARRGLLGPPFSPPA